MAPFASTTVALAFAVLGGVRGEGWVGGFLVQVGAGV